MRKAWLEQPSSMTKEEWLRVMISDLSYENGQWRALADALARIVRDELRPRDYGGELPGEVVLALAAYDELVQQYDGSQRA